MLRHPQATRTDNLADVTSATGRPADLDPTEPPLFAVSKAFSSDFGLIATFGGMGLLVNGIVVYIYFQVRGERQQNEQQRAKRAERFGG